MTFRKWLPELPQYDRPITIKHMLYHTSGLRDYLTLLPLSGHGDYEPISHEIILDVMARQGALHFDPGDAFSYSNTGYMLLAQIVERSGGELFGEFARNRIFAPSGMSHSLMYDDARAIVSDRAIGYDVRQQGTPIITHNYNFDVAGDGQMYSTVTDLYPLGCIFA